MSDKELVTLTIDGQTVQVPKGTAVLEAAKTIGIRIPHYCYHPGLSVVGSCRMCLVEVEKIPKLQPSCATPATEGMVVRTETPETLSNRRSVLELLLLNHPLDCPVCDQAGECELQNYYMEHGLYDPRFNEDKTKRKKAYPIGPHVILDQERCVLCTRCVRFTQEISKTGELGVHDRGHRSDIDLFPGTELDNPYSGNVVDICPVGALTDRDFRFQCRVWFLGRTPSICPGCSRGCNMEIHYNERFNPRYHEKRVHRLKPRYNGDVNQFWLCDEGRYGYHSIDASNRLKTPLISRDGVHTQASWPDALEKVASTLQSVLAEHGAGGVAVLASPQMSNEELFLLRSLFRDHLKVSRTEYRVPLRGAVYSDDFLVTSDKNPNSRGAQVLGFSGPGLQGFLDDCSSGQVRFLYICHHELAAGPEAEQVKAALAKVGCVVFHGSWKNITADMADVLLPAAVYAEKEGTFTNVEGRVQRFHAAVPPLGESLPDLEILARLASVLGVSMPQAVPEAVFLEIGRQVPAFAGLSYETLGATGHILQE